MYIVYGAVVVLALYLGRWYARERDIIIARGEPWINSFKTKPGVMIILILGALIVYRIVKG